MLDRLARRAVVALAALAAISASPALAAGDPCAGGLGAARIIDCLRPEGVGSPTRGIRPTAPKPGAAATQAAPAHATVNLTVPFAYDSAELTPQGTRALEALAAALKDPALASARFEIGGHTDASGTDDYNMKLSERRAQAAHDYLQTTGGVAAARLTAVGYGRTQLYDAKSPTAAVNRRVQVTRLD